MKNIIETSVANPDFSTLVTAIKAADLVDTLSGSGPFTVFAPTNSAFEKIPEETLKSLLSDKTKLASILTYHVVAEELKSKDIVKISEIKTVQGSKIIIDTKNGVMVNNVKVTNTDIECSNGVIHTIDTVLMPS